MTRRTFVITVVVTLIATAALVPLGRERAKPDAAQVIPSPDPDTLPAAEADDAEGTTSLSSAVAAGSASAGSAPVEDEVDPEGRKVWAIGVQAPVFSASEFPPKDATKAAEHRQGVVRLGYLRRGARVIAKPEMVQKSNCAEGWYELVSGGFVCGKYATSNEKHRDLRHAPHTPYLDRILPYEYGLNFTPGTPLYRRLPLRAERAEQERALAVGKGKKASDVAQKMKQTGEEVPAYLRNVSEKGKPTVGFDELKGDNALIVTRMLKGFYLSLDKRVDAFSGPFWRTAEGFYAPKDHIIVHEGKTEFEGVKLGAPGEARKLPLAWIVGTKARRYAVEPGSAKQQGDEKLERFSIVQLTGKKQRVDEHLFWERDDGSWVRDDHVAVVEEPPVASGVSPGEKWIDIDLSAQGLVAFEGDKPVYATVVSTGRRSSDPAKDHSTPEGSFRVREKHVTTTMDDDAATDGTYRIEDVPWVMYFDRGIALHGAFWHSSFGRERSHGCVNLTPHDARHIFMWSGPHLPKGWHGVRASEADPGTRIVVHK